MAKLTPPVSERDHLRGAPHAPVTLLEFGDYECPYCGAAHPIVQRVQQRMGDRLRFVFRHLPLAQLHPHAEIAAEAAEAAGAQRLFWEMHDILFENQRALDELQLIQYATELGLDVARFQLELASHVHAPRVHADSLSALRSGANGTPTFFINGARHDGSYDEPALLAAVQAALRDTTFAGAP